jgi:hypothetical protein
MKIPNGIDPYCCCYCCCDASDDNDDNGAVKLMSHFLLVVQYSTVQLVPIMNYSILFNINININIYQYNNKTYGIWIH